MMQAVYSSKEAAGWFKQSIKSQVSKSSYSSANMVTLGLVCASMVVAVSAEIVWKKKLHRPERRLDYRVLLQLFSSGLYILACVLYMGMMDSNLYGGSYLSGLYLSLFGGIVGFVFCVYLFCKIDEESLGDEVGGGFRYKMDNYGSLGQM
mmetsp:Transcript_3251/g.6030  ORF Transcript_3251/g.6030 Transcript_3251/m.6030 type:complete len:150 (-) Transcript_3251:2520-2969(-)